MVSVIMPVYDRTSELREAVESILNQSYCNFELLLVTDGSPRETLNVVERYRDHQQVRLFHYRDNSGNAVRGRNRGICEARGEFIAFQDSDDLAEVDRLRISVECIRRYDADIVYGGWRALVDGSRLDTWLRDGQVVVPVRFAVSDLLRNNRICQSTVLARRNVFAAVGGYKDVMKFREDHELWLRAAFYGCRFKSIPNVLASIRVHQGNHERNYIDDDQFWYRLMLREYRLKPGNAEFENLLEKA